MLPTVIKQTETAVPQHRIKKPQTKNKRVLTCTLPRQMPTKVSTAN